MLLSIVAVLFAIPAVSNLLKPFQIIGEETGFMLFWTTLTRAANTITGPMAGLSLLACASSIWQMKRLMVDGSRLCTVHRPESAIVHL